MPSSLPPSMDAVPHASTPTRTSSARFWILFALGLLALFSAIAVKIPFCARLLPALMITLAFAVVARVLASVTGSGAAAGFLVTSMLLVTSGPAMFVAALLVFVLTLLATKFGKKRKQSLRIAERSGGRDGAQVMANVGISAIFAVLSAITSRRLPLLVGSLAALAEAACDTVSSETGKALALQARLVTSGRLVPAGTDGAISIPGTLLGVGAAALVALEAMIAGLIDLRRALIVAAAGTLGMFLDSLLGATLERRGRFTNNAVNFVSTLAAALLATTLTW
ncbi:MAG: hypothetical protein DMG62_10190 [Acidobacteria bacterium]|nr:MAG: hypothetical protein DMG62_10190 [Acidobacteriota bacterium]